MTTSSRERQRKWKVNQTSAGRKAISVMLAADIKTLINQERKRTGETIASIIEKAVVNLFNSIPADSTVNKQTVTSNNRVDLIKSHPNAKEILMLVGSLYNSGTNPTSIAYLLNMQNYKTFSGNDEWTEEDAKDILDVVENNRPLYSEIVYGT